MINQNLQKTKSLLRQGVIGYLQSSVYVVTQKKRLRNKGERVHAAFPWASSYTLSSFVLFFSLFRNVGSSLKKPTRSRFHFASIDPSLLPIGVESSHSTLKASSERFSSLFRQNGRQRTLPVPRRGRLLRDKSYVTLINF